MMRKIIKKENKAITLIALVITIIVLLILAGITVAQLSGNNLFENAKLAKEKYKNSQEDEDKTIEQYGDEINNYVDGTRGKITLTEEEYNMFIGQFSKNTNIPKVSINKPNTWTAGTEYDFGDGVYGKRFTGTITASANTFTTINLLPASSPAIDIIDWGGQFYYANNQTMPIGTTWSTNNYNHGIDNMTRSGNGLNFGSSCGSARTNQPYDIWMTYTK